MKRLFFVSSLFLVCYFFSYFSLCANAENEIAPSKGVKKTSEPISFFIVIPSYNNELWYKQNLDSIAIQNYPNWHAYYINDCSTDKTGELVEKFVKDNHLEEKFTIVHNTTRKGALANTYNAIQTANPCSVVVIVDGDDQFVNDGVLDYVARVYKRHPKTWLTYGSYISQPFMRRCICTKFPKKIIRNNAFRKYRYISAHLRTFYAGLFQLIKKEDLMINNEFLQSAGDVATMLPMLEMASLGHFRYLSKVLYIYRDNNPLNDFRNRPLQKSCSQFARSRPAYTPLRHAPWLE